MYKLGRGKCFWKAAYVGHGSSSGGSCGTWLIIRWFMWDMAHYQADCTFKKFKVIFCSRYLHHFHHERSCANIYLKDRENLIFFLFNEMIFSIKNWSLDIILSVISMRLTHIAAMIDYRTIKRKNKYLKIYAYNMNMICVSKEKNWIFSEPVNQNFIKTTFWKGYTLIDIIFIIRLARPFKRHHRVTHDPYSLLTNGINLIILSFWFLGYQKQYNTQDDVENTDIIKVISVAINRVWTLFSSSIFRVLSNCLPSRVGL